MTLEYKLIKEIESYRSLLYKLMLHITKLEMKEMELSYKEMIKLVEAVRMIPRSIDVIIRQRYGKYIVSLKTE